MDYSWVQSSARVIAVTCVSGPLTTLIKSMAVIDADVHHGGLSMVEALGPHLSRSHREQLEENGYVSGIGPFAYDGGLRGWRDEDVPAVPATQPPGGAVAWDIEATRRRLFEDRGVDLAILTGGPVYGAAAMPDLDYASSICRAFNQWTFDNWLAADRRFRFAMSVCSQDPAGAVAEIERIGSQAEVAAVLLPTGSARHLGLPIAIHAGADGTGNLGPITSAGSPSYLIEEQMMQPGFYQVHLGSLIFEGVFDRLPGLRVVLLGSGVSWVPAYVWRMDNDWKALRYHTPWVQRLPSEYVFEHVRFGSQPLEGPPGDDRLADLLGWIRAGETMLFASHFPRWDGDEPDRVAARLPAQIREHVLAGNARSTFRL